MKTIILFMAITVSVFGGDGFEVPPYRGGMSDLELQLLIGQITNLTVRVREERFKVEDQLKLEKLRLNMFQERAEERKHQILALIVHTVDDLERDVKSYRTVRDGVQTNLLERQATWSAQDAQIKKLEQDFAELEVQLADQEKINRDLQSNISKTRAQITELRKSIPQLRTAQRDHAKKVWRKVFPPTIGLTKYDPNTGQPMPGVLQLESVCGRLSRLMEDPE